MVEHQKLNLLLKATLMATINQRRASLSGLHFQFTCSRICQSHFDSRRLIWQN